MKIDEDYFQIPRQSKDIDRAQVANDKHDQQIHGDFTSKLQAIRDICN